MLPTVTDALRTERHVTAAEFAEMPEDPPYELVRGRLVEMCRPTAWHGTVTANVASLLCTFVKPRDLGNVSAGDNGFWIERDPDTVRGPDVAFVRKERIPPSGLPPRSWEIATDLVVEVISPTDRFTDIEERTQDWLRAGAEEVWLVDPRRSQITVVRKDAPPAVFRAGDTLVTRVLPGFAAPVADVFAA